MELPAEKGCLTVITSRNDDFLPMLVAARGKSEDIRF
jgi:hypothetical protein